LAAAIPTVYPRPRHQRLLGALRCATSWKSCEVRPCGSETASAGHLSAAVRAGKAENSLFASFGARWRGSTLRHVGASAGTGLTGVAVVLAFPGTLRAKLPHTNVIRALLREAATENPTLWCGL